MNLIRKKAQTEEMKQNHRIVRVEQRISPTHANLFSFLHPKIKHASENI